MPHEELLDLCLGFLSRTIQWMFWSLERSSPMLHRDLMFSPLERYVQVSLQPRTDRFILFQTLRDRPDAYQNLYLPSAGSDICIWPSQSINPPHALRAAGMSWLSASHLQSDLQPTSRARRRSSTTHAWSRPERSSSSKSKVTPRNGTSLLVRSLWGPAVFTHGIDHTGAGMSKAVETRSRETSRAKD